MALAAVAQSPKVPDVAERYKTHDQTLTKLSTEMKTAQAAAEPLGHIKTLFWIMIPVCTVLIRYNVTIFFPLALASIVIEAVASYYHSIHATTMIEARENINIQMNKLVTLEEGQLTPAKKEVLKKHPKVCSYFRLSDFTPGIPWNKAKEWLKKKQPDGSALIEKITAPQRVAYQALDHVAGKLKTWKEKGADQALCVANTFIKSSYQTHSIISYRDAEEMIDLMQPERLYLPYNKFHTPKLHKLAINNISSDDFTFEKELASYTHIQDLVKEDIAPLQK